MRLEQRFLSSIIAICLANGLAACGSSDDPRESSGSSAQRSADGTSTTPVAEKRTVAPPVDALGGAPSPEAPADSAAASGGATFSDPSAPAPLTPATNDTKDSADPACYKAAVTVCQLEQAILRLTNAHRADRPLALDPRLSFVARAWSGQQLLSGIIGHAGFPLLRETAYVVEFGAVTPYFLGAENVGTTYGTDKLTIDQLAAEIVDMWWSSTGHRTNILGNYAAVGIGVSISADARTLVATQLFGAE